ncbi:MAG TPA: thiamine phosphate synthase [Dissulfurispiraceae bacterium]|nr:thiamine phosphate synthase [Dissulfurispiraceae bacterium]
MKNSLRPVCAITPVGSGAGILAEEVHIALDAGIRWVQFRRKGETRRQLYDEAEEIRELTREYGALFIVNDFADIALAVGADGLHIGQDDLPLREARKLMGSKIIGVSTHNLKEAVDAEHAGADYIGFGPIFQTVTKETGPPKGLESLEEIVHAVTIPVIAIGGINVGNADSVFSAGCDGVAVSSGIFSGDITANITDFLYNVIRLNGSV